LKGASSDDGRQRIAIIGAGIGGLTVAAALRQQGISVELYEQAKAFARVGSGIQVGPNAMKALRAIGLGAPLERLAFRPPGMRNREWDTGRITFELPLGEATEAEYGAPYLMLHRGDLHAALAEAVPASLIHFASKLVDLEPRSSDVRMIFEGGDEVVADAVVAADGVHSVVRERLLDTKDAEFTGRVAYRTVFPASRLREQELDPATKWWGPDRHIVIYHISGGQEIYFTTSVPDAEWRLESWSAFGDVNELIEKFEGFHPQVQAVLRACQAVNKWAIYEHEPLRTWQAGRVVLLGDACHPMTPYMAQGAATAMEDAVVLARCVGAVDQDGIEEAFSAYERRRIHRTSRIQLESRKNQWLRFAGDAHWVYDYDAASA
jgi:salicylate hydroxylase/6-hydroxynicotinate 3-monooxygenase